MAKDFQGINFRVYKLLLIMKHYDSSNNFWYKQFAELPGETTAWFRSKKFAKCSLFNPKRKNFPDAIVAVSECFLNSAENLFFGKPDNFKHSLKNFNKPLIRKIKFPHPHFFHLYFRLSLNFHENISRFFPFLNAWNKKYDIKCTGNVVKEKFVTAFSLRKSTSQQILSHSRL